MNFEGVWCPVVTPFNADQSVDYPSLGKVINSLVEAGVHGLIVGGTTGEYYALSKHDRVQIFDFVASRFKGVIPLCAGINSTTTQDCSDLGLAAKKSGFDAILMAAPYYCQPTQQELIEHCIVLDKAIDLPIMLYNFPDRTGVPMSDEFLEAVVSRPNFQAIKESTGSIERLHTLVTEYSSDLQVCCGMDDQILEYMSWGASSWVGGAANFLPKQHVEIYNAFVKENDIRKGRELVTKLLPMLNLLEQGGKFVQCIKFGCELAGNNVGVPHKPLLPLTESEKVSMTSIYNGVVAQ